MPFCFECQRSCYIWFGLMNGTKTQEIGENITLLTTLTTKRNDSLESIMIPENKKTKKSDDERTDHEEIHLEFSHQ